MLMLLVSWMVLGLLFYLSGLAVLYAVGGSVFIRCADRALLAVWLGMLLIVSLSLGIALFTPLSPAAGAMLAAGTGLPALLFKRFRLDILQLARALTPWRAIGILGLLGGISFYCSQTISHYDTGLYHYNAIQWLGRFGIAPGMALINSRLGFVSSWFTLPAFFNHGVLETRVIALPGGFVLCLAGLHIGVCLERILHQRHVPADVFLAVFIAASLAIPLYQKIPATSSPDLPAVMCVVLAVWVMMVISGPATTRDAPGASVFQAGAPLLPLLLACGALTVKLTAAPLVCITALYACVGSRRRLSGAVMAALVVAAAAGLLATANTVTSGCPWYPVPICLDVPWSVGADVARFEAYNVLYWAKSLGHKVPGELVSSWLWPLYWAQASRSTCAAFVLVAASCLSLLFLLARIGRGARRMFWAIATGVTGMAFLVWFAPDPRFGWGYFTVIPCLWALLPADRRASKRRPVSAGAASCAASALMIGAGIVIALVSFRQTDNDRSVALALREGRLVEARQGPSRLWLPPGLISLGAEETVQYHLKDFMYTAPRTANQCWATDIPCSDNRRLLHVMLRDSEKGFRAGFVRTGP